MTNDDILSDGDTSMLQLFGVSRRLRRVTSAPPIPHAGPETTFGLTPRIQATLGCQMVPDVH